MTLRPGRLDGKVALITGAGGGIGHAITKLFLEEGARVAAIVRSDASLAKWQDTQNVIPIQADITQLADVERMVAVAEAQLGGIDILANVAGINDLCYPLHETTDERWDSVLDLDLKAPFRIIREVLPGMMKRGRGAILNVGTYAALRGNHGPSYTAAKTGLSGLTASVAVYYARNGIRCNLLNPGAVNTGITEGSGGEYHDDGYDMFKRITQDLPVTWICEPEEIARSALFLCSDDSSHVNGAILAVDGGMAAC
jgi:NAD(P)-dependent dehydrogenase (short-subunit alcohol dehydrogenase family)